MRKKIFIIILFIFLWGEKNLYSTDPTARPADGEKAFWQIPTTPRTIRYSGSLPFDGRGGHLQGVQIIRCRGNDYAVLTGSSEICSYYAVVRLADPKVARIHRLLDKPWKHAGGFQIFQGWMALGIEDNTTKNRSKVRIYEISDPQRIPDKPAVEIERTGVPLRATAGCVAITAWKERLVVIVGDWDSRHLDFYFGNLQDWRKGNKHLDLISTVDAEKIEKTGWVDQRWLSYQNINLFTDQKDRLFLIGMAQDEQKKEIAALFLIDAGDLRKIAIHKIATREFQSLDGASFRSGSGIVFGERGALGLVSCNSAIGRDSVLNLFLEEGKP